MFYVTKTKECRGEKKKKKTFVLSSSLRIPDPYLLLRRRQWHPTPVLLPGKSYGQRSLVGAVHGVAMSETRLSDFTFTFHFYALEKERAAHFSVLAWRIPGMGSHRVGHD